MFYDISDKFNNYESNQRLKKYIPENNIWDQLGRYIIIGNPNDISYIFYFLDATTYVELYA